MSKQQYDLITGAATAALNELETGDLSDLPNSLDEGDHYLAVTKNSGDEINFPILFVGPNGGGTPQALNSLATSVTLSFDPDAVPSYQLILTGSYLADHGNNITLSKDATGDFSATMDPPPTEWLEGSALSRNEAGITLRANVTIRGDTGLTEVKFTDNFESLTDPGDLMVVDVPLRPQFDTELNAAL